MKKKSVCNKFIFLSIACLFTIFAFSCVNKVESDNLVGISGYIFPDAKALSGKITSHIYGPSGNSLGTVETCFLEGWEDIPFLRFEDVCFIIGSNSGKGYVASREGSIFKYKYGPGSYPAGWENDELCFDVANQTIYSDEFMRIITSDDSINNGFAQWPCLKIPTASTACPKIEESASTTQIVAKQRTTIDLKKYDLKMFEIEGELYVPFILVSPLSYNS